MKNIFSIIVIALLSITNYTNASELRINNSSTDLNNGIEIIINANDNEIKSINFDFNSATDLENFDLNKGLSEFLIDIDSLDECTASITVTVSVGVVSVSATVDGIACEDIISEAKRLISALKEML